MRWSGAKIEESAGLEIAKDGVLTGRHWVVGRRLRSYETARVRDSWSWDASALDPKEAERVVSTHQISDEGYPLTSSGDRRGFGGHLHRHSRCIVMQGWIVTRAEGWECRRPYFKLDRRHWKTPTSLDTSQDYIAYSVAKGLWMVIDCGTGSVAGGLLRLSL